MQDQTLFKLKDYKPSRYLDFLRIRSLLRGQIFLIDEIESELANKVNFEVEEASLMKMKKLRIIICSPGGDVFPGLAIYDALDNFKKNGGIVETEARGYAASMGSIILQAGTKRLINANAKILIHEVREFGGFDIETASSAEEKAVEMKKVNEQLIDILAKRSGNKHEKIESLIKRQDCWLSAKEAKELNLVDAII